MSKSHMSLSVGFTVLDIEDLPDGLSPADVWEKVNTVVTEALAKWYTEGGGDKLLASEPLC